jgi:hypothetical protein
VGCLSSLDLTVAAVMRVEIACPPEVEAKITSGHHIPDRPPPPAPLRSRPLCASCGTQMDLERIEPHPRFINAQIRVFVCTCGKISSDVFTVTLERNSTK